MFPVRIAALIVMPVVLPPAEAGVRGLSELGMATRWAIGSLDVADENASDTAITASPMIAAGLFCDCPLTVIWVVL